MTLTGLYLELMFLCQELAVRHHNHGIGQLADEIHVVLDHAGRSAGVVPLPTTGYGAGGAGYASGVSSAAANGVAGTSGVCIIEEYA